MRRVLVTTLLLLGFLAGCTTIPTAGPVESIPVTAPPRGVELAPDPPVPGITPDRLVDGFLQAMADPEADYEVARQYLSREASEAWDPAAGALVYDGSVLEDEGTHRVQGRLTGRIDEVGRFTATDEDFEHVLPIIQEDGEWRIGRAPEGVLVSAFIFERYYAHATVYFMARSGTHVVPELIHIPEALLTPNKLVEAQIAGPSSQLAPAVRNALPGGVKLADEGASVDPQGVARVALENLPDNLSEDRRRELAAQLMWSFTAIGRVTGLVVLDGSSPLTLPGQGADGVLELASQQGYQVLSRAATSDLFGVRRGAAGRVSVTGQFATLQSSGIPVGEVAVSLDGALVAFIDENRRTILIGPMGGQLTQVVPDMVDIRSAQFVLGRLWVLGDNPEGRTELVRIDSQGRIAVADTESLPDRIVAMAMSQTGARTAFLLEDRQGDTKLGMAAMSAGAKPRVETWHEVVLSGSDGRLGQFVDIAWSGEGELVVLSGGAAEAQVHLALLDGSVVEDLAPVDIRGVEISALPRMGGDAVALRGTDDSVHLYEPTTRWTRVNLELQDISYPG